MDSSHAFSLAIKLLEDYKFEVDFAKFGQITTDEPAPLGEGDGPNPIRLLSAAVANCLCASLLFAARKYKGEINQLEAEVKGDLARVEGRWRVSQIAVALKLPEGAESLPHFDRVLAQFEDFCIVTESVRSGIEINVEVQDFAGQTI